MRPGGPALATRLATRCKAAVHPRSMRAASYPIAEAPDVPPPAQRPRQRKRLSPTPEPAGARPDALCAHQGRLVVAWRDGTSPGRLPLATYDGARWATGAPIPAHSVAGPAIASVDDLLYAAWRGAAGDQQVRFARRRSTSDGGQAWSEPELLPGAASLTTPALADFGYQLHAAWRGPAGDESVRHASLDGRRWSAPAVIPAALTSDGPALAAFGNGLYAAWRGAGDDAVWYARFDERGQADETGWTPPTRVPGVDTAAAPALAFYRDRLYVGFRGAGDDERLWWTSFDGNRWEAPSVILGGASRLGTALAVYNDRLYAAWRDPSPQSGLWYAAFSGSIWSDPNAVPATCPA